MARKITKTSMDAAFKSIIQRMELPKQKAIDLINDRLDRLEKLLQKTAKTVHKARTRGTRTLSKVAEAPIKRAGSATAIVLDAIKRSKKGVDVAALKAKTGFDDKKMRNIVARLYKLGKIKRAGRGKYTGV